MKRKLLGILLVAVLVVCAFTVSVSATAGTATLTATAGEIVDGEVKVDISLTSDAVVGAFFTVDAPEGFTLKGVAGADADADGKDDFYVEASQSLNMPCKIVVIDYTSLKNVSVDQTVATLTFAVDENLAKGKYEIVLDALEVCDIDQNLLTTTVVNGWVCNHEYIKGDLVPDTADKAAYYPYTCDHCQDTYEEVAVAVEYNAAYGSTVVLESDLRLQIVAKVANKITDPSKIWLIVESTDADGNVTKEVVNPYHAYPADEAQTAFVYRFNATRVAAKEIGDKITVTFCANIGGVKYAADPVECNIISYYNAAQNAGASELVMNVLKAMMNYGAAAQEYFGYNTDKLVTDTTGVTKIDYTDTNNNPVTVNANTTYSGDEGAYTYDTVSASLKDKVVMVIKFNGTVAEGLVFKGSYEDINGKAKTFETAATVEDGAVVVKIDAIAAKDLRQQFTGALYNDDTQVSKSVTTSFEAYATQAIKDYPNNTSLHAVCRAALAYSDAAKDYFLSK